MAEITIIIPMYNAEKTLRKCLDSVKAQNYKNYGVILIDDCSTDNSAQVTQEYGYKIIKLNQRSGQGKARNIGAQQALTKYLAFTDSDCILPKDWLSKIMADFKNRKAEFICDGYSGSVGNTFLEKYAFYELLIRRKNLSNPITSFPSNNFACNREIFIKEKGFSEQKNYVAEDLEFSLEVGRKYKIFWDKNLGIKHHFHKGLKKYIKQQYRFARDTIYLYLRKPNLKKIKTYQEEKNKFVIFYTAILELNIVLSFFYSTIVYLIPFLLIIILLLDFSLINYISKKEGIMSSVKSMFVIILRNMSWTTGMISGIIRFFV